MCSFFPEEFEDCYAYGNGFIGGAIIATNSTIDISQSKFECNGADIGGAILLAEQQSRISMSGVVFLNNSVTWTGGVLYSNSSRITIETSEFQNNSAIDGGVLYIPIGAMSN